MEALEQDDQVKAQETGKQEAKSDTFD